MTREGAPRMGFIPVDGWSQTTDADEHPVLDEGLIARVSTAQGLREG